MKSVREQRSWITNSAILANYLPEPVVDYLLSPTAPPPAQDLSAHIARLNDLLHTIVSFVPEHAAPPRPRGAPALGRLHAANGTLLAADLSGFTAFSAQLSTLGSEGAELVAHTINQLFSMLLGTLAQWDGRLLKLSGDALTAMFSGRNHAWRATTAALELQRRMAAFAELATPAGLFTLRIRIGIASGPVRLAHLGGAERIELLVAGAAARRVMEHQRHASPGAVVFGSATYSAIRSRHPAVELLGTRRYRVSALGHVAPPQPSAPFRWVARSDSPSELQALIGRIEALRPYLVDQHLARLADGSLALLGDGDLRPVTILFASLGDTTPLLEPAAGTQLPAAMTALQLRARQIWEIVAQYGGTINKFDLHPDGHTLMVLFGAPLAQSREAERAVACALALARAVGGTGPLQVRRLGIASGRVFAGAVGSPERREYTVMGAVVNLAARLMDAAEPGQVLLDAATAQATEQRFLLQPQPPRMIKGYTQPVPYVALAPEQGPRLNLLMRAPGALVGREAELAQARAVIGQALARAGGVVVLAGEAGMGKSRLLAELVHGALLHQARAVTLAITQAQPAHRARPYQLLVDLLRQLYDLPERSEAAARFLADRVARELPEQQRFVPLLAALFGLPANDSPLTQALTPDERRARLQELAVALLLYRLGAAPAAFVLEDMHWADAASLAGLSALVSASAGRPLLLLCTCRPEGAPSWPTSVGASTIVLHPLPAAQCEQLISSRIGMRMLAPALRAAMIERTQGNPFFIEELVRALGEQHASRGGLPPLPTSIQGALIARFDRLPLTERYLLQLAAVIGLQFDRSLLAGIAGAQLPVDAVLAQLAERGLVRPLDEQHYRFVHSLTQETIYESMLFAQRRELHRQIADTVCTQQPERAKADPGLLATHYLQAEAWPEALDFAWSAGLRAQALYAGDVALAYYQQALHAAAQLDPIIAAQRRAPILRRIGDLLALAGRFAEATAAYSDAFAASGEAHERAKILIAWTEICEGQAAYDEALALLHEAGALLGPADEALALRIAVRTGWLLVRSGAAVAAQSAVAPCLERLEALECWGDLVLAYKVFFHIAMGQSRWRAARSYLRLAITNAERAGDLREIGRLRNNMGIVLTQEGNLRAAVRECERAAAILRDIGDQNTLASVEVNIGAIHYKMGDFDCALAHYNASLRSAEAIGALPLESIARSNIGELYRRLGRLPESLAQLRRSVALCHATQDDLGLSEAQRQLAETFIEMDRLREAEAACAQALSYAQAAHDTQAEAIVYRVCGQLAAARGDYDQALADSRRSVQLLTELGSTPELGQSLAAQACLWLGAGRPEQAQAVLEEALALFQRAGATADLAQASDLLGQIRAGEYETKVQL